MGVQKLPLIYQRETALSLLNHRAPYLPELPHEVNIWDGICSTEAWRTIISHMSPVSRVHSRDFESCEDATVLLVVSLEINSQKSGNDSRSCTRVVLGSLIAD